MTPTPLKLERVGRRFRSDRGSVVAVEDFTLELQPGEVFALVGESGCGKSTVGRIMAGLLDPSEGSITYMGNPTDRMGTAERQRFRLGVQYIHQDPYSALIPSLTVGQTLTAPLRRHRPEAETDRKVASLLAAVGLNPPDAFLSKFPNELSGGQRQRVSIARALTVEPAVLVADEAVSMIDVSLRLSILDTIAKVRAERGMSLVMITHDLGVAHHVAADGRVGVMYLGRLVEVGPAEQIFMAPQHPYTRALIAAADHRAPADGYLAASLRTEIPRPTDRPKGCAFHPRCLDAIPFCAEQTPRLLRLGDVDVACHVAAETHRQKASTSMVDEREDDLT